MPTVSVYLNEQEMSDLINEAKKAKLRYTQLLRKIVREWLLSQGYGAE